MFREIVPGLRRGLVGDLGALARLLEDVVLAVCFELVCVREGYGNESTTHAHSHARTRLDQLAELLLGHLLHAVLNLVEGKRHGAHALWMERKTREDEITNNIHPPRPSAHTPMPLTPISRSIPAE